jgi:hypothetical protein
MAGSYGVYGRNCLAWRNYSGAASRHTNRHDKFQGQEAPIVVYSLTTFELCGCASRDGVPVFAQSAECRDLTLGGPRCEPPIRHVLALLPREALLTRDSGRMHWQVASAAACGTEPQIPTVKRPGCIGILRGRRGGDADPTATL